MTEAKCDVRISKMLVDDWTDFVPSYYSYYATFKKMQREKKRLRRQRKIALVIAAFFVMILFGVRGAGEEKKVQKLHCVESGETLWSVSREYKPESMTTGEFVYELKKANSMETSEIYVGDIIIIPE